MLKRSISVAVSSLSYGNRKAAKKAKVSDMWDQLREKLPYRDQGDSGTAAVMFFFWLTIGFFAEIAPDELGKRLIWVIILFCFTLFVIYLVDFWQNNQWPQRVRCLSVFIIGAIFVVLVLKAFPSLYQKPECFKHTDENTTNILISNFLNETVDGGDDFAQKLATNLRNAGADQAKIKIDSSFSYNYPIEVKHADNISEREALEQAVQCDADIVLTRGVYRRFTRNDTIFNRVDSVRCVTVDTLLANILGAYKTRDNALPSFTMNLTARNLDNISIETTVGRVSDILINIFYISQYTKLIKNAFTEKDSIKHKIILGIAQNRFLEINRSLKDTAFAELIKGNSFLYNASSSTEIGPETIYKHAVSAFEESMKALKKYSNRRIFRFDTAAPRRMLKKTYEEMEKYYRKVHSLTKEKVWREKANDIREMIHKNSLIDNPK